MVRLTTAAAYVKKESPFLILSTLFVEVLRHSQGPSTLFFLHQRFSAGVFQNHAV
jgi:hypothetical protein